MLDIIPFEEPPIKQINEQPRLYTFKEVNDLVLMIMDHSVMHDRLIQAENNIETIFKNIQELREQDQALKDYID